MLNSSSFEKLNSPVRAYFSVPYQGALISGLVTSDFTRRLYDPTDTDVEATVPVTVAELGTSGHYHADYTNNAGEEWLLSISHPTYFPSGLDATALVYAAEHSDSNDPSAVLEFSVFVGSTPVTGLVTGDFTFQVWDPSDQNVVGLYPVTIVELGNGRYRAKFDASAQAGDWFLVVEHPTYFPLGITGVWRYRVPVVAGSPVISDAVNDGTGTSATLTLSADDEQDELFIYYRTTGGAVWSLFGSSRIGSGDLQVTGLTENVYEFMAIASREGSPSENPSVPSVPVRLYVTDGALSFTEIRQALYDWVADQLPWTTVWKMPNAPQPNLPFVAIRMMGTQPIAEDSYHDLDDAGTVQITGDREFMFMVDFMGTVSPTGENPALSYAEQVSSSLQKRTVLDTLAIAGLAHVERLPIQDLTAIASVEYQARYLLEVRFRIAVRYSDVLDCIETSDAPTGTVNL